MKTTKLELGLDMGLAEGTLHFNLHGHSYSWPYRTDLVNVNGCNVHFWTGWAGNQQTVAEARRIFSWERDLVTCTWQDGHPSGFYARPKELDKRK